MRVVAVVPHERELVPLPRELAVGQVGGVRLPDQVAVVEPVAVDGARAEVLDVDLVAVAREGERAGVAHPRRLTGVDAAAVARRIALLAARRHVAERLAGAAARPGRARVRRLREGDELPVRGDRHVAGRAVDRMAHGVDERGRIELAHERAVGAQDPDALLVGRGDRAVVGLRGRAVGPRGRAVGGEAGGRAARRGPEQVVVLDEDDRVGRSRARQGEGQRGGREERAEHGASMRWRRADVKQRSTTTATIPRCERRRPARGQADLHLRRLGRRGQDDHLGGDRARHGRPRPQGRRRDDRPGQAAGQLARPGRARERAAQGREARPRRRALGDDARRQATFDDVIDALAPDAATRDQILDNRIYQQLSGAVAGTQEFTAMAKLYELHAEGDCDLLVLDTPPSRNALDFLDAPDRLTDFLEGRALQVFLRPAGFASKIVGKGTGLIFSILGRVTGTDLLSDLSVFFQSLGGVLDGLPRARERGQGAAVGPGDDLRARLLPRARAGRGGDLLRREARRGADAARRRGRQPRAPRHARRRGPGGRRGRARRRDRAGPGRNGRGEPRGLPRAGPARRGRHGPPARSRRPTRSRSCRCRTSTTTCTTSRASSACATGCSPTDAEREEMLAATTA